jgi:hypothetical protein
MNVDATGGRSEGDAIYPGRPAALLVEQIRLKSRMMGRRESAEVVVVSFATGRRTEHKEPNRSDLFDERERRRQEG